MARRMKDSGIEWIGEIPEGWSKNKVIRLFDIIGSGTTPKNITSDFPVVNWIQSGDITGSFMPACKNVISANLLSQYSALKVYPAPFIIIAMYGASVGNASISLIDGCVNQACCVLSSPSCNLHYAFYVIKSAQSYLVRKAVGGGQPNISQETIKQLWLPLPPLSIQDIIVRNLDATCSKIYDVLISVSSSIEEYKKLKQAVITQAVTKGVRGEREMKDSGVAWIGEIPKEWGRTKIKMIASFFNGDRTSRYPQPSDFVDAGVAFLTSRNIDSDEVDLSETKYITDDKYKSLSDAKIQIDDIIFCLRGSVGKCAINRTLSCGTVASSLATIRPKDIYPKYLLYFLLSNIASTQTTIFMNGICAANLSAENVGNYYITLPISAEQKEIANYLDAKCAEIDGLIAKKEQLVKELESYKKSLIYEVVTGKREV